MILADDNFATIVAAVREGRGIFANIRKFLRYLLSSNIGRGAHDVPRRRAAPGSSASSDAGEAVAVPLLATQILWINLLTDTAPALAMGVDPPPDDVMRAPAAPAHRPGHRPPRCGSASCWVGLVMAVVTLVGARPAPRRRAARRLRRASSRPARWPSPRSCWPSCSTASTPARSARSAFHHLFTNGCCGAPSRFSLALQVAVVHLPFLNDAFDTTPAVSRRLAGLHRAGERRAVGRRGQEAGRAPPARPAAMRKGARGRPRMRWRGLEPPRPVRATRPSTLRVYQFRHQRVTGAS